METRCPRCGTELTAGTPEKLCPRCLLLAGLESQGKPLSPPTAAYSPSFYAPAPAELSRFFPQLEILELLGKGGMGAVYKARQPGIDRLVALKILPPDVGGDTTFSGRFTREAQALAKLNHPNIVILFDFGRAMPVTPLAGEGREAEAGLYYFLMEYIDGVNLRQAMRAGNLKAAEALKIVPQICDALQFAHDEGVVHRDIKPENILLDKRGRVKIADFGLAKLFGTKADHALTGTHQIMGTPHYMAPEQIQGTRDVDHRADIYSLGVTFYEMLTGELPLGRFAAPSKKVHIDVRLDEVVLRTLEVEPEKRYQHAGDVRTEVDQIASTPGQAKGQELPRATPVDPSLENAVADLLPEDKPAAVRTYREATGAGAAEAMSAVKTIAEKHGKDKPVPISPDLILRCIVGAFGFIAGGFWLAHTQTWEPNKLLFGLGGIALALYWVSRNYTEHLRKSRWNLAHLEDTKPGSKPDASPWEKVAPLAEKIAPHVRRAVHTASEKMAPHARRAIRSVSISGIVKLFLSLVGRIFSLITLPWRILRRAWWIIPLAWTVVCAVLFGLFWLPNESVVDKRLWPYEGWSEDTVSLRPAAQSIQGIVIRENRESRVRGMANEWIWRMQGTSGPLLRDNYEIILTLPNQDRNCLLEVDGLNRLAWHYVDRNGAVHRGELPMDLPNMVQFLKDCGVAESESDHEYHGKALLNIVRDAAANKNMVGGASPKNQRPPVGRLETIVLNQEQDYERRGEAYPFSDHVGTMITKFEPVIPILWVGLPVMLTIWLAGLWWLRRLRR